MLTVRGRRFKVDLRGIFFTQTVVSVQNELSEEVVERGTVTKIKRHPDFE